MPDTNTDTTTPVHPPYSLHTPDTAAAVYDFIRAFALPELDPERIIRGQENRHALPAGSYDYVIYDLAEEIRHGTNVTRFTPDPDPAADGVISKTKLVEDVFHIDFYGESYAAADRAAALELAARDSLGVDFFKPYQISVLYADPIEDRSFVNAEKQHIRRLRLKLHLCRTVTLTARAQYFNRAAMRRVENVDVHHPPAPGEGTPRG